MVKKEELKELLELEKHVCERILTLCDNYQKLHGVNELSEQDKQKAKTITERTDYLYNLLRQVREYVDELLS